jgi:multiple antibiotic resistance protein
MTPMDAAYGIKLFGALFAIMNPLVNLPIFLSLTEALTPAQQRRTALQVMLYTTVMCAVVAVAGQQILGFFGISVEDFRVAGGVVLGGIALHMLSGGGNPMHEGSAGEQAHQNELESVAFYPMTFPMLVGPGTITTLVVFLQQARGAAGYATYAAVLAATLLLLAVTFCFAGAIGKRMSATLPVIMSRLMGMILLAIAIDMLATGVKALLPGLGG